MKHQRIVVTGDSSDPGVFNYNVFEKKKNTMDRNSADTNNLPDYENPQLSHAQKDWKMLRRAVKVTASISKTQPTVIVPGSIVKQHRRISVNKYNEKIHNDEEFMFPADGANDDSYVGVYPLPREPSIL